MAPVSDLYTELRRRVRHGVEQLLLALLLLQEPSLNLENHKGHKVSKPYISQHLTLLTQNFLGSEKGMPWKLPPPAAGG